MELALVFRLLPASFRTRVGLRENRDLIHPTKTSRRGTYLLPFSLRLREVMA